MKKPEGNCDMGRHYVAMRKKSHIFEGRNDTKENILMLCPACHIMLVEMNSRIISPS